MSASLDLYQLDGLTQELKTFLGFGEDGSGSLQVSFTQNEEPGIAEISLRLNGKRVLYILDKQQRTFSGHLQITEGDCWVDIPNDILEDGLSDLSEIVRVSKEIAQGLVNGSGSS